MSSDCPYCSRELGLALHLQKERRSGGGMSDKSACPIIIPIYAEDMEWRRTGTPRPTQFPVRDFWTGELIGEFDMLGHDPHGASVARTDVELRELMKPLVHLARRDLTGDQQFLKSGVLDLYEELFPPSER